MIPQPGDLLVIRRPSDGLFTVMEAIGGLQVEGPFDLLGYAVGMAHSIAAKRHTRVWRERVDDRGTVFGPPVLLEKVTD